MSYIAGFIQYYISLQYVQILMSLFYRIHIALSLFVWPWWEIGLVIWIQRFYNIVSTDLYPNILARTIRTHWLGRTTEVLLLASEQTRKSVLNIFDTLGKNKPKIKRKNDGPAFVFSSLSVTVRVLKKQRTKFCSDRRDSHNSRWSHIAKTQWLVRKRKEKTTVARWHVPLVRVSLKTFSKCSIPDIIKGQPNHEGTRSATPTTTGSRRWVCRPKMIMEDVAMSTVSGSYNVWRIKNEGAYTVI